MNITPKRRKHRDNPYTINYHENKYFVEFIDGRGIKCTVEVKKEIYNVFNVFELEDKSAMNKYERHIEHINNNVDNKENRSNLEEEVVKKIVKEELEKAIDLLPIIQKERIKMYYFENMTLKEIAKIDGCTPRAVKFSIDIGLKKLKKLLTHKIETTKNVF